MAKILLIEDDDEIRTNVEEILESHGYNVLTATNGKDGKKLAREIKPDLILCDIMMPYLSGYEVLESINQNSDTQNIPFIFLTAKVELSDIRKGMNLGADDYIVKPFRAAELLTAVATRLERVNNFAKASPKNSEPLGSSSAKYSERVMITVDDRPYILKFSEIKYITAYAEYTNVFLADGSKIFVRKLLKNWEDALPETMFLRVHRSTIVNLDFVKKVEKWYKRSFVIYIDGVEKPLQVSQRFALKIKEKLSL